MADTRGCWSLSEAWAEKGNAEWVNVDDVYLDTNEGSHGFWLGGTNKSNFDKLVYATDTISNLPDANLQSARYYTTGSAQIPLLLTIISFVIGLPSESKIRAITSIESLLCC